MAGILEIKEETRVYRCVSFSTRKLSGVMFFWDKRFMLPRGYLIELSVPPILMDQRVVLPFEFDDGAIMFIVFGELSPENQKEVRQLFPLHSTLFWIN